MVGCYEKGKKENLGHGQMGCTVRMALDAQGIAEFKKHFKKHLGIMPGEDFKFHIVEHDSMLVLAGYCMKDQGKFHFRIRSKGFTKAYLQKAYEAYQVRLRSPLRNRKSLNQSNVVNEAYIFYKENIYPIPPPNINTVLTYMVNSGLYMPSSVWATKKDFDLTKAQVLWQMMLAPKRTQPGDSALLFFSAGDPHDLEYMDRTR